MRRALTISLGLGVAAAGCAAGHTTSTTPATTTLNGSKAARPAVSVRVPMPQTLPEVPKPSIHDNATKRPPQYVLMSFDGTGDRKGWKDTLEFADDTGVKFTYFVSGVVQLRKARRRLYRAPGRGRGATVVAFSESRDEVLERIAYINRALASGHEIGSHGNGHFNGKKWSYRHWMSELGQFNKLMFNQFRNNDLRPGPGQPRKLNLRRKDIAGFRAPYLKRGKGLWKALSRHGYTYDSSGSDEDMTYWPSKRRGVWFFPLARIPLAPMGFKTHSMDYNLFVWQWEPKQKRPHKRRLVYRLYEEQVYQTFLEYFLTSYNGNRSPVHIGHHYKLHGRILYWNALKRFARKVCGLPEVRCVTYKQLVKFLEHSGTKNIARYRRGDFDKRKPLRFELLLGSHPGIGGNPLGRSHGASRFQFCSGQYLGKRGAKRRYACYRKASARTIKRGIRFRGWKLRWWRSSADGHKASAIAARKGRRIRIEFNTCYLSPCYSGFEVFRLGSTHAAR